MSESKEKNKLLGNIASLGIVQIANYVFPLISIPIISRIIGPDKYGVINYAYSFVAYFTLLVSYGFDLTATRRLAKEPDNNSLRNIVFSEVLKAKLLLFLVSIFIFIICLFSVGPLEKEKAVAIFSFLNVLSFVFTQNWLFQAMQNLKKVAILNFVGKLLFTVFVILVVRKKDDYIWQPLIISISQIIVALMSLRWAFKIYKIDIVKISIKRILELLLEERTIFLSMLVVSFYTTTNTVILGILRSNVEVGYFTAAGKLMDVANSVINMPLAQAFYPFIGKAFAENKQQGIEKVQKITPAIFYFTFIAGVVMFFIGPIFLKVFYGNQFTPSIPVFKIMSFIPMIVALNNVFGIQIMLNLKMDKAFFYITLGGAILSIGLNLLLVKHVGYIGTAWNWFIVECGIALMSYIIIVKKEIRPIQLAYFNPFVVIKNLKNIS